MLSPPKFSVLGLDPNRKHRINANSFQQNAITTLEGWQYAVFYTDATSKKGACYVNLARRRVLPTEVSDGDEKWDILTFEDYEQTRDDGHDIISLGVCKGDGTIHLAFDQHCDQLKFRISSSGLAHLQDNQKTTPSWSTSSFSQTQDFFPGIQANDLMKEVTYPRFVNIDNDLLLSYRIGQAGLGSDILYRYHSSTHAYTYLGQHLTGVSNSPYINGMDSRLSRVHMSWCYRNFVAFDATATPDAHKQQAGPNGPENNYDLNYAYSDDCGSSWNSSDGTQIAALDGLSNSVPNTIKPGAAGAKVFDIPMCSGILNQEAQAADWEGGFYALNRENTSGEQKWVVYYRSPSGSWNKSFISSSSQPTERGARASMCVDKRNNVYLILPGNTDSSLSIMRGRPDLDETQGPIAFETIWSADEGFDGEPLVDVQRLEEADVLSVFTRTISEDGESGGRCVVVLDFELSP